jgi:hypothetical protein
VSNWQPPHPARPPRQLAPATIAPCPLESTGRDIGAPGSPIICTPLGVDEVARLAAIGASDAAIAGCLRMSRKTFRAIKRRQPEVAEALSRGRATLHVELQNHLLVAAREGQWGAAGLLLKLRFGGDGSPAHSSQGDEDDEADEEPEKKIDWDAVPEGELAFISLASNRIKVLRGEPDPRAHVASGLDDAQYALHCAVHLLDSTRALPLLHALTGFIQSTPDPNTLSGAEVERLCAALRMAIALLGPKRAPTVLEQSEHARECAEAATAHNRPMPRLVVARPPLDEQAETLRLVLELKPTIAELQHIRAMRLTPHERRHLTDGETVANGNPTEPIGTDEDVNLDVEIEQGEPE